MSFYALGELLLFGLAAGLLIGCVGIGGVILVPLLAYVGGYPIQAAISMAMLGYVLSGAIGTWIFAANKSIRWDMVTWIWLGAIPTAFAGAFAANTVPPFMLELAIGVLAAFSGFHSLLSNNGVDEAPSQALSAPALVAAGGITGVASSLTGTGGPLLLVPILVWLELPPLTAIGLAQTIQVPIALFATAGNVSAGNVHVLLSLVLGGALAIGTWIGAKLAHAIPRATLKKIVSVVLVAVGVAILARLLRGLIA